MVDGVEALLAPLLDVGAAGGNAALLPEQEEALCVLLLTLHSFSTAERLARGTGGGRTGCSASSTNLGSS